MSELAGLRQEIERQNIEIRRANEASTRWEQRTMAAEQRAYAAKKKADSDRAAMQVKIDRLLALVEQLRNGDELKAMTAHAEKAEKTVADLLASHRSLHGQVYGSKSHES